MKYAIPTFIRKLIRPAVLALMLSAAGFVVVPIAGQCATQAAAPSAHPDIDYLPNIPLLNQDGKPVRLGSLKGKPVLVSFIHASCKGVCELMTAKMKSVADDLGQDGAKVTMVSITTDPAEDRPAELKAYASKEGVAGDGFIFLTGKPAMVKQVLEVYGVNQKSGDNEMTHVFELFLIGPDGREVRRYHGLSIDAAKVAGDIQQALAHG
jgi:protein SCO1